MEQITIGMLIGMKVLLKVDHLARLFLIKINILLVKIMENLSVKIICLCVRETGLMVGCFIFHGQVVGPTVQDLATG